MLFVVGAAALTVLTFPPIADISKAAVIVFFFFFSEQGRVFLVALTHPGSLKHSRSRLIRGLRMKRVPDVFIYLFFVLRRELKTALL